MTLKLGIQPMIYVSPSFWSTKVGNNTSIAAAGYKLWIANWGVTSPTVPANNWSGHGYTFWQYSDCGHVAGITTGCVDLDRYPGTSLAPVTYNPTFSVTRRPDQPVGHARRNDDVRGHDQPQRVRPAGHPQPRQPAAQPARPLVQPQPGDRLDIDPDDHHLERAHGHAAGDRRAHDHRASAAA